MTRSRSEARKQQRAVLDAMRGIGGGTVRSFIQASALNAGEWIPDAQVSAALAALQRKGLAFSHDAYGSLSIWRGINRGRFWSTRQQLKRDFRYTDAEIGRPETKIESAAANG